MTSFINDPQPNFDQAFPHLVNTSQIRAVSTESKKAFKVWFKLTMQNKKNMYLFNHRILTWPNQDNQMNIAKFCEHDRKIDNDLNIKTWPKKFYTNESFYVKMTKIKW